jgi:hypothetical protein
MSDRIPSPDEVARTRLLTLAWIEAFWRRHADPADWKGERDAARDLRILLEASRASRAFGWPEEVRRFLKDLMAIICSGVIDPIPPDKVRDIEGHLDLLCVATTQSDDRAILCTQTDLHQFCGYKGRARGGTIERLKEEGYITSYWKAGSKYRVILSQPSQDGQFREFLQCRRAAQKRGGARQSAAERGKNNGNSSHLR